MGGYFCHVILWSTCSLFLFLMSFAQQEKLQLCYSRRKLGKGRDFSQSMSTNFRGNGNSKNRFISDCAEEHTPMPSEHSYLIHS